MYPLKLLIIISVKIQIIHIYWTKLQKFDIILV